MKVALATLMVGAFVECGLPSGENPFAVSAAHGTEISEKRKIEVVFVLDTTGSMSGLIQTAKEKIWSIANTLAQAKPTPEIRIGLVAFRDRGDEYVTKLTPQSTDLDAMYRSLMELQAAGGGDEPESVNQALNEAITKFPWSSEQNVYRVVFLVGDAPPHENYANDVPYPVTLANARKKGIFVNTIQCGSSASTEPVWKQVAQLGEGTFTQVAQDGGAFVASSPYDERLAALATQRDETRLSWGSSAEQDAAAKRKDVASEIAKSAPKGAQASRAVFNAGAAGASNFATGKELIQDLADGRVQLDELKEEQLPADIRAKPAEERAAEVRRLGEKRAMIDKEIAELGKKRQEFLAIEASKAGKRGTSLDDKLHSSMKDQASKRGFDLKGGAAY